MPEHNLTALDLAKLSGVHEDLVRLAKAVSLKRDIRILEGLRTEEQQAEYVARGTSRTMHSKHLVGRAVDLAFVPIDWNDIGAWREFGAEVKAVAEELGINVKWGGDWKTFFDGPHFELADYVPPAKTCPTCGQEIRA